MSVRIEADEKIDNAKHYVQQALAQLNAVVVDRCWGHGDYTIEYKKRIAKAHASLVEVRDELG